MKILALLFVWQGLFVDFVEVVCVKFWSPIIHVHLGKTFIIRRNDIVRNKLKKRPQKGVEYALLTLIKRKIFKSFTLNY